MFVYLCVSAITYITCLFVFSLIRINFRYLGVELNAGHSFVALVVSCCTHVFVCIIRADVM